MAKTLDKSGNPEVHDEDEEWNNVSSKGTRKKKVEKKKKVPTHLSDEYPRGIMKIASYSGVVRRMKCTDDKKCGKLGKGAGKPIDEIVNIYVYPDGAVNDYPNHVVDPLTTNNAISKINTYKYDAGQNAIWIKREKKAGKVRQRSKKLTKTVKRTNIRKLKR